MAETIEIRTPDGTAEAFLARGGARGVLFFMDAIGLRPRIAEMVDEIASWGYTVLAPHVFYREGRAADLAPTSDLRVPDNREAFFAHTPVMEYVARLTPDRAATDTAAYVDTLRGLVGEGPLATVGFCMGARLAMRAAGQFPGEITAVACFHGGGLVTEDARSPHTTITPSAEYVFGHADHDRSMTPENAAALDAALEAAGATYTSAIYPDAPHGYTMADTSSWHELSYHRAMAELRSLLERQLG